MLPIQQQVRPHPDVVDTELEGQVTVLHLESKFYFSLNATGTRIWNGLKRGASPADISQQLQEEFAVEQEHADQSVLNLITELAQENLVERAD